MRTVYQLPLAITALNSFVFAWAVYSHVPFVETATAVTAFIIFYSMRLQYTNARAVSHYYADMLLDPKPAGGTAPDWLHAFVVGPLVSWWAAIPAGLAVAAASHLGAKVVSLHPLAVIVGALLLLALVHSFGISPLPTNPTLDQVLDRNGEIYYKLATTVVCWVLFTLVARLTWQLAADSAKFE